MLLIFNLAKQRSNLSLSRWETKKRRGGRPEGAMDSTLNWNHRKFLIY